MSLTRQEAERRAALLAVSDYAVDIDLTRGDDVFGSTTTVRFTCSEPGASTFVELAAATVHRVTLNGADLDPAYADDRIPLTDLREHNVLLVEADLPYTGTGDGMHRFVDPADGETYVGAYCGTDLAHHVFAAFDQPDLKAAISTTVTADPVWTVLGNGVRQPADPGTGRWSFATTPPISTYLFVLVAGPLHSVHREHAGVAFGLHCRRSLSTHLEAESDELFATTFACWDRYGELFDEPYAFGCYDQAFVPGLNWGALETPGCITFRDELVFRSSVTDAERRSRGTVIAHEMAHMWFGDLVSMRWWDDLWLSESFAELMGILVLADATGADTWTDLAIVYKTWGYDADQRPSTHPVAAIPDQVETAAIAVGNADGITYAKGAAALRQLLAWLGHDAFFAGVNLFIARHRFASASMTDLFDALAEASGHDVHAWGEQWLRTTGVDTIRAVRGDGAGVVLERDGSRPHLLSLGLFDREPADGGLRRRGDVGVEVAGARTTAATGAAEVVVVNDEDLGYCKVRLDDASWAAVVDGLSSIDEAITRAVLWTAARDMVRDGELAAHDFLVLAIRHLVAESDSSIFGAVTAFTRAIVIDRYLDPMSRPAGLEQLSDLCCRVLVETADGRQSDRRLSALRGAIDSASGPDGIRRLRQWTSSGVADGPPLDADLRWRLLNRLAVLGATDPTEIEGERIADASSVGEEGAARCRAALPDPVTKRAAWESLVAVDEGALLSNRLLDATAAGFWQPEQQELLGPYVPAYFDAVVDVAARRGPAIAEILGTAAYPRCFVDDATLELTQACLRRVDLPAQLRRCLEDEGDDLRRAIRVRARVGSR